MIRSLAWVAVRDPILRLMAAIWVGVFVAHAVVGAQAPMDFHIAYYGITGALGETAERVDRMLHTGQCSPDNQMPADQDKQYINPTTLYFEWVDTAGVANVCIFQVGPMVLALTPGAYVATSTAVFIHAPDSPSDESDPSLPFVVDQAAALAKPGPPVMSDR